MYTKVYYYEDFLFATIVLNVATFNSNKCTGGYVYLQCTGIFSGLYSVVKKTLTLKPSLLMYCMTNTYSCWYTLKHPWYASIIQCLFWAIG